MTRGSQQPIALRRIDRLTLTAEVLENPLDHRRILKAGDDPQPITAAPAPSAQRQRLPATCCEGGRVGGP